MNEAKCKKGDVVKCNGMKRQIEKVLSSYIMDEGGVAVEFIATDGQYYYYKQDFDGGEYIRREEKKMYIDSYGVDCTDIFKKYGYC